MKFVRIFFANIVSVFFLNKVMRRRVRGHIVFGPIQACRVAIKNRRMRHAPPTHYLTICAIAKNEGAYFKEWIDWHVAQGVQKFYIYNNESTDNTVEVLQPYIDSGLIEYNYIVGKRKQTAAYNDCLARHRYDSRWIAFIDLDEFIVPIKAKTIPEFLKDFEGFPAVEINWLCYGSGGAKTRKPGGVMERFRSHSHPSCELNRHVKSIVNPRLALNFLSSHHPTLLSGCAVDTNGNKVRKYFFQREPLHDTIRINHYAVKSFEEFLEKKARGRGMSLSQRGLDYFEKFDRNEITEDRDVPYQAN
ncbi:MAG: glycosyltransferase family 92 protein [Tenuifilaceae bacterium]|nr:glycosyltransferase family 92 protein [Tenuifilaceae bacterium]